MSGYCDFAYFYDRLMSDVNYSLRTEYLLKLFESFGKKPTLLLDLACGTGGFSNEMAKRGIEVIGADMSEDMLSVARENSAELGLNVLYLCQKAEELDLYGTVDAAICCMDSINHITTTWTVINAFRRIALFLEPNCLFIFDINTEFKHKYVLGDNTFVIEDEEIYCVWQNEFSPESLTTKISLDFFVEDDGRYDRFSEEFCERAYKIEELEKMLSLAGFRVEAVYDDMTENPLKEDSQRAIIVARKT